MRLPRPLANPRFMFLLFGKGEDAFWRLVRFEAESEPERLDWGYEVALAEQARAERRRQRRAELLDPDRDVGLTLEQALARLQGVKGGRGGKWMARCPVHDDRHPSLLITEKEAFPGEPYFHCFAGCDFRAIQEALKRHG